MWSGRACGKRQHKGSRPPRAARAAPPGSLRGGAHPRARLRVIRMAATCACALVGGPCPPPRPPSKRPAGSGAPPRHAARSRAPAALQQHGHAGSGCERGGLIIAAQKRSSQVAETALPGEPERRPCAWEMAGASARLRKPLAGGRGLQVHQLGSMFAAVAAPSPSRLRLPAAGPDDAAADALTQRATQPGSRAAAWFGTPRPRPSCVHMQFSLAHLAIETPHTPPDAAVRAVCSTCVGPPVEEAFRGASRSFDDHSVTSAHLNSR